jgi:hypothetical protein
VGFQKSAMQRFIVLSQSAAIVNPLFPNIANHALPIHPDSRPGYTRLPGLGCERISGLAARTFDPQKIALAFNLTANTRSRLFFKASPTRRQAVTVPGYL